MLIDIDECNEEISGCSQLCTNTIGSYTCACHNGYQLGNDNHTCTDIDECTNDNGGCEQTCTNTIGSFVCSCLDGYSLDHNNYNCTGTIILKILIPLLDHFLDINECIFSNGDCNHDCTNIPGSYSCSCRAGYSLNTDGHNCSGELTCYQTTFMCQLSFKISTSVTYIMEDVSKFATILMVAIIVPVSVGIP